MKSLQAFIRKNRWILLFTMAGVLLIRWRMRHDGPERLMVLPEGALLTVYDGKLVLNQGGANCLDLILVDIRTGTRRSLRHESHLLALFLNQQGGATNYLMEGSWLYYLVLSDVVRPVPRTDGRRAIEIPPLILRRVDMRNGTSEELQRITANDALAQANFDPNHIVVTAPPFRLHDNAIYWVAPDTKTAATPRLLVEGLNTPPAPTYRLLYRPLNQNQTQSLIEGLPSGQLNFALEGDRLYWADGKEETTISSRSGSPGSRNRGHTSIYVRHLPNGPTQRLASDLNRTLSMSPTPQGLYIEEAIPDFNANQLRTQILYFDPANQRHPVPLRPPLFAAPLSFNPTAFQGRVYLPILLNTDIPGLKGIRTGCLLSMKPDGSDQKQLVPISYPIVVKIDSLTTYQDRLYVTADVKKSYYDGLAPVPLLTRFETTVTEHLQPLPHAFGVAGMYFDGDSCYYVVSEEQRNWRTWFTDPGSIPIQKILYRYRLPDRRHSP